MRKLFIILLLFISPLKSQAQDTIEDKTVFKVGIAADNYTNEKLPLVEDKKIKNVIFLIGDGTGLAQISAGQLHLAGIQGYLNIQRLPVLGLVKTYATDNLITDSASGATAYSCGEKTNNGMIAQLPDGTNCKTVLEYAIEMGLSTGLVATSGITHATPASYASHVASRNMQDQIAAQYLDSGVNVLLGGGVEYFIPSSYDNSKRTDSRDLIEEFKTKGYEVSQNKDELAASKGNMLLGLYADSGLLHEDSEPTLAEMTTKSIEVLSKNEKGFFLMVEGSQIDWGGHQNNIRYTLDEVKSFDDAVGVALDFAVNDGETLVVITADHETGGLSLTKSMEGDTRMEATWSTGGHTGIPIPLTAYGPNAGLFGGWHENTEVGRLVADLLGIAAFPQKLSE